MMELSGLLTVGSRCILDGVMDEYACTLIFMVNQPPALDS